MSIGPGQVANDLGAWGSRLAGTGRDQLCVSLIRGQATIRNLLAKVAELEAAAEAEASRVTAYQNGDDL